MTSLVGDKQGIGVGVGVFTVMAAVMVSQMKFCLNIRSMRLIFYHFPVELVLKPP